MANGRVYASVLAGNTLYIGGTFTKVQALAIFSDGSTLSVGGSFDAVDGHARNNLAAIDLATGQATAYAPQVVNGGGGLTKVAAMDNVVHTILATSTRVYLGVGAHGPNWVGSYDGGSGTLVWKFGTMGNVRALSMTPDGSRLYFGGHFGTGRLQQTVCGTQQLHGLAFMASPATTGSHSPDCGWIPSIEPFGSNFQGIWTIQNTPSFVWVGGGFKAVGGVSHLNLARFTL